MLANKNPHPHACSLKRVSGPIIGNVIVLRNATLFLNLQLIFVIQQVNFDTFLIVVSVIFSPISGCLAPA